MKQQHHIPPWRPGPVDAFRAFLLSENFQGAVQLSVGILFVSIFSLVNALRFPGACIAVLLYIVVAVVAAPNNHVGTRIYMCGFMIGPMWLAMATGGVVATLAKLVDSPQGHLVVLCILGPLAIIPFAINRVGTSHWLLWAMGMISALYVGLPILGGFAAPDPATLWIRAVGFVLVAALIAMFAGSVLSMVVLPTLATHQLEDDVCTALRFLGQHLSCSASQLLVAPAGGAHLALHMKDLHPLVVHADELAASPVLPGVLDKDLTPQVPAHDVYMAVMDWFEHMSRPPGAPGAGSRVLCLPACRTPSSAGSTGSFLTKSTFYGPGTAAAVAAAIASAAEDEDCSDAEISMKSGAGLGLNQSYASPAMSTTPTAPAGGRLACAHTLPQPGQSHLQDTSDAAVGRELSLNANVGIEQTPSVHSLPSATAAAVLDGHVLGVLASTTPEQVNGGNLESCTLRAHGSQSPEPAPSRQVRFQSQTALRTGGGPKALRLGSGVTAADVAASKSAVHLGTGQPDAAAGGAVSGGLETPVPSIADVRQLLGAAVTQLLDAAKTEPQWLRAGERRFDGTLWAKVIQMAQLLALRMSALDLLCRDQMLLLDRAHSFPMRPEMVLLVHDIYGSAAALLAHLAAALADRGNRNGRQALADAVRGPAWQKRKADLLRYTEHCMTMYWHRISEASPQQPVTLPRAQWLRQWFFFITVTVSIVDTVGLLSSAAAAVTAMPLNGRAAAKQQQRSHQDGEAGAASAAPLHAAAPGPQWSLLASFKRHTAWVRPWLPDALNVEQFKNLRDAFTVQLPKMFSSRAAFVRQLKGRRFQAGVKYWFVLSAVLVSILVLMYFVPESIRLAPNFGYSAAAVGMSDRVESTVYKVVIWTGSSVLGAVLGWLLMLHPGLANNGVALAAVLCSIAFVIGSLGRSRNSLVTLYTLMTIASIVLCQFVGCCDHTGSTMMAVTRGGAVAAAAVFAVAFQNLVLPWYTSSWALETMGEVYQEATDLLAELVLDLYTETHALMLQSSQPNNDCSDPKVRSGRESNKKRQQQQQAVAGGVSRTPPAPQEPPTGAAALAQQLQARLVKPLVQVKMSLVLDTTAWQSGLYATPPVVTRLLPAMFDLVDSLGALQQSLAVQVKELSGTWDWTLLHSGEAWGSLLMETIHLGDAAAAHLNEPSTATAARVLRHIQAVQHKRYEVFVLHRDLRRLLLVAIATDEQLLAEQSKQIEANDVEGRLRYPSCIFAIGKVLDRITAAARCALDAGKPSML
eukprot:gene9285-9450_t